MFSIQKTQFGPYDQYVLSDNKSEHSISIIPSFGGLMNDWTVKLKSGTFNLLQNYKEAEELNANIDVNFQGPKLIPYPNRIENGSYSFNDRTYQLEHGKIGEPNSIHGFLNRLPMEVIDQKSAHDQASLSLLYEYDGTLEGYPFKFELELTYSVHSEYGLMIQTNVTNTGDEEMPFGDGWHPYMARQNGISELQLQFHARGKLLTEGFGIPTGVLEDYHEFDQLSRIGNTKLDDCFELANDEIVLRYPEIGLQLKFWQEMGPGKYNYLQVYTPEDRKSVAIEPMTCAPNAFNNGMGLIKIPPREAIELKHGVRMVVG